MEIDLKAGKYIVAVSGGVDSVVLLDVVKDISGIELVVAHLDHGIRNDSADDENFVRELAGKYHIPFVSERVELGVGASEEQARVARYDFLRRQKDQHGASAILTAHHQDDLLETMILNVLRGTGRRGLDPLLSSDDIKRPLIAYTKQELTNYALDRLLAWREDSTNADTIYKRNAVRHTMMPKLSAKRRQLLQLNKDAHLFNKEIEQLLTELDVVLRTSDGKLIRSVYVTLPHAVAAEYMHWWLMRSGVKDLDKGTVTRATLAAKTLPVGKKINLGGRHWLQSNKTTVEILSE